MRWIKFIMNKERREDDKLFAVIKCRIGSRSQRAVVVPAYYNCVRKPYVVVVTISYHILVPPHPHPHHPAPPRRSFAFLRNPPGDIILPPRPGPFPSGCLPRCSSWLENDARYRTGLQPPPGGFPRFSWFICIHPTQADSAV